MSRDPRASGFDPRGPRDPRERDSGRDPRGWAPPASSDPRGGRSFGGPAPTPEVAALRARIMNMTDAEVKALCDTLQPEQRAGILAIRAQLKAEAMQRR